MGTFINVDVLSKFIKSEIEFDRKFFETLIGHFKNHLAEFRTQKDNPQLLGACAHKTKSSCRIFGAQPLGDLLESIEISCKEDPNQAPTDLFEESIALIEPTLSELAIQTEKIFTEAKHA